MAPRQVGRDLHHLPRTVASTTTGPAASTTRATCPARPATACTSRSPRGAAENRDRDRDLRAVPQTEVTKVHRSSHMPVREGKMECTTCHNPHGSQNVKMLREGNSINEACATCHAEKRGPFLWEHAAGARSCVTCHDPHGSNNERMLVAKLPMLCQRCHVSSRHPATIYENTQVNVSKSNRAVGRACVQLPRDDSWVESSVGRGLLQVRQEDAMRTRTMILTGALLLASAAVAAAQDSVQPHRRLTRAARQMVRRPRRKARQRPDRRPTFRWPPLRTRHD